MAIRYFYTKEHTTIDIDNAIIEKLSIDSEQPEKYLCLFEAAYNKYYIGCKWLVNNESVIVVEPKIENIDYLKMFLVCFNSPITSDVLANIYKIDFTASPIPLPAKTFELTPFIIIHFLNLLKKIVKKGLKKDYIWIEENLSSKIKGKVLISKNIKYNFVKGRADKNYCKHQEYSYNCIENKILKKTLNFISSYLKIHFQKNKELLNLLYFSKRFFDDIDDDISINSFKQVKINSLYKEYNEILKEAKLILKRFDYSINKTTNDTESKFPPFHINMALLFELYSYTLLHKVYGNDIKYQYHGKYGEIDFLNTVNKTIIDTKYKVKYKNEGKYEIDDIRQLSAYSRDINVLKKVGIDISKEVPILDCVIVYPNQKNGTENIEKETFKSEENKINQFYKFYKYGIKLPEK